MLLGSIHLLLIDGVSTDLLMSLEIHVLDGVSFNVIANVAGECLLVHILIFFLQILHVFRNVVAEDTALEHLGVKALLLSVGREALLVVRDVDTAIDGTLHHGKHLIAGGRRHETDVKNSAEGAPVLFILDLVHLAVNLLFAGVHLGQTKLGQMATRAEKADAVRGCEVGETALDPVARQLVRIRGGKNLIAGELCRNNLADDVPVFRARRVSIASCARDSAFGCPRLQIRYCECAAPRCDAWFSLNVLVGKAGDNAELGRVVLALILRHQTATGLVVSLAFATPAPFGLVAAVIGLGLRETSTHHDQYKFEHRR